MADDEKESGAASIVGKDPKKRKFMAIGIGLAALLVVYFLIKGKGSSAAAPVAAQQGVPIAPTADVTVPSDQPSLSDLAMLLGLQNTSQPGTAPNASNPSSGDIIKNGQDIGQYLFGQNELNYLQGLIGQPTTATSPGISQSEYNDVLNAFNNYAAQFGQAAANQMHYTWNGPGQVDVVSSQGRGV